MTKELLSFLSSNKIFSSLDDTKLSKLLLKFTRIELEKDKLLFEQGDPSDEVYILVKGKLTTFFIDAKNHIKTLSSIEEGDVVGELGAITKDPRSISVKANEFCVLYALSAKDFIQLCNRYPALLFEVIKPVVSQTQQIMRAITYHERDKHIVITPANAQVSFQKFSSQLLPLLQAVPKLILISDLHAEFSLVENTLQTLKTKIKSIIKNKKFSQQIFYLLSDSTTPLAEFILSKAHIIYLVANASGTPEISPELWEFLKKAEENPRHKMIVNLVLLHPTTCVLPQNTAAWLQEYPFNLHHQLRIDTPRHYKRLLRFMRGKATGLILGGGGTRGWAHVGALKALRTRKIPIDFVGGTSVGSIVAGCYAIQESYQDVKEKFGRIVKGSNKSTSWMNITWPLVSIFNGKAFTEALLTVFKDIQIEDLWLPYFCLSSNLADYSEEIHRSGSLYEKTRASASLPGIIPPMIINGEIHFDGGLLNNLPVDVMRQFLGRRSKIIAVELTSFMHDNHKYIFPPALTLFQALSIKFGFSPLLLKFPRFIDMFLRGMLLGSSIRARQNGLTADILIDLNLRKFRLLTVDDKQAQKLLETGYVETLSRIYQHKNKNL